MLAKVSFCSESVFNACRDSDSVPLLEEGTYFLSIVEFFSSELPDEVTHCDVTVGTPTTTYDVEEIKRVDKIIIKYMVLCIHALNRTAT
mmetsp:Transcript_21532/g.48937  ORF Transcript_21532/g.48937 Transcript_21532/m.48937 type:complete len:89 (+) Transcript_21532:464-730(+)